jgi:hypothetical protein
VYPLPVDGDVVVKAVHYPLDFVQVHAGGAQQVLRVDLFVADVARLQGRDRSRLSLDNIAMTEFTLNAHSALLWCASVDVVREGDRLRWSVTQSEGWAGKP